MASNFPVASELHRIKQRIREVLEEAPDQKLLFNTFWNAFRQKHAYLPDHCHFGLGRRSAFFQECSDFVDVIGNGNNRIVRLKKNDVFYNLKKERIEAAKNTLPKSELLSTDTSSQDDTYYIRSDGITKKGHKACNAFPDFAAVPLNMYQRDTSSSDFPTLAESSNISKNVVKQQAPPATTFVRQQPSHQSLNSQQKLARHQASSEASLAVTPLMAQTMSNSPAGSAPFNNRSGKKVDWFAHQQKSYYGTSDGKSQKNPTINPTKDELNDVAEDSIERLVEAKEYVSLEKIEKLLLQHYSISSLQQICRIKKLEDISVVNDHLRKQCKANAYIQAFARVRPIATLYELCSNLKEFVPENPVEDFEELKLGPLQKQPLVYQYFKFPPESEIPEIETFDVVDMLRTYLSDNNKWTSRDLDMEQFMIFIKEAKDFESPYESGVKIKSLPLAVQVLKRSQRECGLAVKGVITQQKEVLQDDVMATFRHFASNILTKQVGYCEVKKQYLTMNALEVILEVCGRLQLFYDKIHDNFMPSRAERKLVQHIENLRNQIFSTCRLNKTVEAILRLAICCGQEEIHQHMWAIVEKSLVHWEAKKQEVIVLDDDDNEEEDDGPAEMGGVERSRKPKPQLDDISMKINKYLDRCLAQGALNLGLLSKIESKLCEDYKFPYFTALGHGSFLDLLTQGDIKKYLDECGGSILGGVQKGSAASESLYHATQHDVMDFVKQCALSDASQLPYLESALCSHYQVKEVKSLGLGSAKHLLDGQSRGGQRSKEPSIFYEAALCAKEKGLLSSTGERKVGILGHQSRESALACLQNCPLLEDLADWSHWALVFQPQLGPLKEFVQKYGRVYNTTITDAGLKYSMTTHILAMETKPGVLIKLTSDSSNDKFALAADSADSINTCGHLLSLLATNKGLDALPTALLGNHMKTALFKIQASSGVDHVPGGPVCQKQPNKVCEFVVECLTALPFLVCQALANKVFLEPLASVIGKAKSKDQLLQATQTTSQKSRLQVLGCALGVSEWSHSFEERKHWPRECLQQVPTLGDDLGGIIESTLESESELETESDTSDTDETGSITLSDDDSEEVQVIQTVKAEKPRVLKEKTEEVIDADRSDETQVVGIQVAGVQSKVSDPFQHVQSPSGNPCRAIVEQIRKEEFGVSVVLSEDGQKLMLKQQERLGRSLDRLSKDLYSKDTHFVLELIQNADDNEYPRNMLRPGFDVYPSVEFVVEDDKITVLNNESGFLEKNIRALCDVGRSTKGKHKFGYIGQKGIGFKSVFRVTNRPEIHSNGYHICFDVQSGPMGYILPHWIGKTRKVTVQKPSPKNGASSENAIEPEPTKVDLLDLDALIDLEAEDLGVEDMDADVEEVMEIKDEVLNRDQSRVSRDHVDTVEQMDEGGVLEEFVEDVEEEEDPQGWTTHIVLPLKEEVKSQHQTLSLAARFHDVHPSLLLFLHRLRRLHIVNRVEEYNLDITRRDLANNIVEIQYKDTVDRWLVVKKTLNASQISKQAKSGVEVESTEIALAFQLQTSEERATQILPEKQPVFAFLPLRSYGFRFVIQGDFDVPSSREDVDRDSMWNQWILGEIHKLFVESVQTFKDQPSLNEVEAVCSFLQFVPMEDEILDFFRPVASRIMQQLRARPCLPTQSAKGKAIQWKMPSQLVINKDPLVSEVVTSELLQKHLNLDYLHRDVVQSLHPGLIASLGVQTLTTQHLMDIGRVLVDKLNKMDTDVVVIDRDSDVQMLSKWLTCIYRSMDEFGQNEDLLAQLQTLPIIPLTDGQMVKLQEKTVFFPLADDRKKKQNKIALLIQTDINTIDKQLFSKLDDVSNSQVRRLLEMLGVKTLSPRDVIHHHIMPVLKQDLWKSKKRQIVFAYVVYIKQHYQDQEGTVLSLEELKPHLVVETNQGLKKPVNTPVHFTPAYLNPINLPEVLPGHNWVLLDAHYVEGLTSKAEVQKWSDFFTKLGVLNFLGVKREEVTMTRKNMEDSPWEKFVEILPPLEKFRIVDCECSEFYSLVIDNDQSQTKYNQMKNLFLLLDQQYDSYYKQFMVAQVMTPEGHPIKEIDSTFAMLLKQVPWLPGAVVQEQEGSSVPCVVGELMEGTELYVRTPNTEKLLSHHVPYLDVDPSTQSTFSQFLGIRHNVKIEDVQEHLIEWCTPDEEEDISTEQRSFRTSMGHIKALYRYLKDNLKPKELQDLFQQHPVIFYTPEVPQSPEQCVAGVFLSRDKVRWNDPSGLFQRYGPVIQTGDFQKSCRMIISRHYPESEFKDHFVKVARIQKHPEFEEFAKLLIELSAIVPLPQSLPDILKIFAIIGEGYLKIKSGPPSADKLKLDSIKTLLQDKRIIPVKGNKMTYPEEEPLIADDREKESQWKGKSGVNFVDIGDDKHRKLLDASIEPEKVLSFLEFLGIPRLSERLEMTPTTESYRPCPELQYYMHKVVPYIQQLLFHEHEDVYKQLNRINVKGRLATMTFAQVSKLELVQHLKIKSCPDPIIKNEKCRLMKESKEFFVHMDSVQNYNEINEEIAMFFCPDSKQVRRNMKYLLRDLKDLVVDTSQELDQFLSEQKLQPVSDDEALWEVPPPANWPPREPTPPPPTPPVYLTNPMMEMMQSQQMSVDEVSSMSDDVQDISQKSKGLKQWPPPPPGRNLRSGDRAPQSGDKPQPQWKPPAPADPINTSNLPEDLRPSKLAPYKPDKQDEALSPGHSNVTSPTPGSPHSPHSDIPHRHQKHSTEGFPPGENHRHQGEGYSHGEGQIAEGEGHTVRDRSIPVYDRTKSIEGIQTGLPPPGVESYNTSALVELTAAKKVEGAEAMEEDEDQSKASCDDKQMRDGEHYTRSQSQIEMEYISSQGDQETISVDENWVGEPGGELGRRYNRKPVKRPRMESGEEEGVGKKPPVIFYGNPVWTETANETNVYEQLAQSSEIRVPDNVELENDAAPPEIGRWGETLVNSYLNQYKTKETEQEICEVVWVNEEKETGLPYDFMLKVRDPLTNELQPVYIEVKSTLSDKKAFFEISSQEFKFAQHWHEHFHIYRVFNAGNASSVRLTKLVNLSELLDKSQVKLCMVV